MKKIFLIATILSSFTLQAQKFEWAKSFGGVFLDTGNSICLDDEGNILTTGTFRSSNADFDPGPETANLSPVGLDDVYVQKLDADGNLLWAKSFGGDANDAGLYISVDSEGNVYTAGTFYNTVDFDPGSGTTNLTSGGAIDVFVQKMDADGNFLWAKKFGNNKFDNLEYLSVDSDGNVYITGNFRGVSDFDPGPETNFISAVGSSYDIYLVKLDTSGNLAWAKTFGSTSSNETGLSIAVDSDGNVYSSGYFSETIDFDPGVGLANLTSDGFDRYVLKLDASGDFVWVKSFDSSIYIESISLDLDGNLFSTGRFFETADFDPGIGVSNLTSAGEYDIFIQKINSSGDLVWVKSFGDAGDDIGLATRFDSYGNIYTFGSYEGVVDFNDGVATNYLTASLSEFFVQKMNPSGNYIWAGIVEGGVNSMNVDDLGNIYTTGGFSGTKDFDVGEGIANLTAVPYSIYTGYSDAFVQKLSPCTPDFGVDIQAACDSYTWVDGVSYTESNNTATYVFTNATGCDSIVALDLTIYEATHVTDVQVSCADYTWIDGNTYTESNNTATLVLTNAVGCDSIISLDLSINVPTSGTDFQTTDSSYTWIDGNSYSSSNNSATHTLTNAAGCDSVVTLHLTVNSPLESGVQMLYEWGHTVTSIDYLIESTDVEVNSQGDIYAIGKAHGPADFDPSSGEMIIESDYTNPTFIQKLDSDQNLLWVLKNDGAPYIGDVTIDGNDELLMVGEYYSYFNGGSTLDLSFGGNSFDVEFLDGSSRHMFVMKTDAEGDLIWGLSIMNENYAASSNLITDDTGNIYLAGTFKGTVDFDPGVGESILEAPDSFLEQNGFVMKISSAGVFEWVKEIDGISKPTAIALGQNNNIIISGEFEETVDFDPGPNAYEMISAGGKDGFVLQLDQSGDFNWAIPYSSQGTNLTVDVITDQNGNVYATGGYQGTIDVDPGVNTQLLNADTSGKSFVVKYNNNGEYLWSQPFKGTIKDIHIDDSGSIYYGGIFVEDIDVDFGPDEFLLNITDPIPVPSASPGVEDVFVLKTDQEGDFVWATSIVGNFLSYFDIFLATDASDNLIVFGEFEDMLFVDPNEEVQSFIYSNIDTYTMKFVPCERTTPVPLVEILPDINDCFINNIEPPQAMNNCGEIFTASYNGDLLEESGAIQWIYEDDYGNGFSQIQYVNVLTFDGDVNQIGLTLAASVSDYSYQWLDCNNDMFPIEGAVSQEFTPTSDGFYAVEISNGYCSVISDCYEFNAPDNDFLSFAFTEQTGPATIDAENKLITIEVQNGTDPTNLIPTFSVSVDATAKIGEITQQSGINANDYSADLSYKVYSADGIASDWLVQLSVSNALTYYVSEGGLGIADGLSSTNAAALISDLIDIASPGDSIKVMPGLVIEETNLSIPEGILVYLMNDAILEMGDFDLENNGHMTISTTGSLVQGTGSSVSGTGLFEVIRQSDNNPMMFNFLSSPIDNIDIQAVFGGSNVLSFDPENYNNGLNGWTYLTSGSLSNAQGVAVNGSISLGSDGKRNYQGMVNNGNISIDLDGNTYGSSFDGWNLIGNPYPSPVDMFNFISSNADVGAVTIYDQSLNSYITYNVLNVSDLKIASGQGFYVEFSESNSGVANFLNIDRSSSVSGTIHRSSQLATSVIRIYNETSYYDSYIGFTEAATDAYNHSYDARLIPGAGDITLYSILDGDALAIQTFGDLLTEKIVPLGFEAAAGLHTIELMELSNFGSAISVLLVDHETGITHQLSDEAYHFIASDSGINESRFELHYKPIGLDVDEQTTSSYVYLAVEDQSLYVYGLEQKQVESIRIFDVNGKELLSTTTIEQSAEFVKTKLNHLNAGIYFVEIHTNVGIEVLQLPMLK